MKNRIRLEVEALEDRLALSTYYWQGDVSEDWGHFQNWSSNQVPQYDDSIVMDAPYGCDLTFAPTQTINSASFKSISFLTTNVVTDIHIAHGFTLALTESASFHGAGKITVDGTLILKVNNGEGMFNWTKGVIDGSGTIRLEAGSQGGANLNVLDGAHILTPSLVLDGAGTALRMGSTAQSNLIVSRNILVANGTITLDATPGSYSRGGIIADTGTSPTITLQNNSMLRSSVTNVTAYHTHLIPTLVEDNAKIEISNNAHLEFEGLTFENTASLIMDDGRMTCETGVAFENASKLVIKDGNQIAEITADLYFTNRTNGSLAIQFLKSAEPTISVLDIKGNLEIENSNIAFFSNNMNSDTIAVKGNAILDNVALQPTVTGTTDDTWWSNFLLADYDNSGDSLTANNVTISSGWTVTKILNKLRTTKLAPPEDPPA